jgi:hypothetical protein
MSRSTFITCPRIVDSKVLMADSLGSISESLEPQLLGSGFVFTEGLLWHPGGYWLFVDPKGPLTHSYLRPSPKGGLNDAVP